MKRKMIIGFVICLVVLICGKFVVDVVYAYHVRETKVAKYYYNDNGIGPVEGCMYITDVGYKDSLTAFYDSTLACSNPKFNFPSNYLWPFQKVNLLSYSTDSSLARVICYTGNSFSFDFKNVQGWVDVRFLHNKAPCNH